MSDVKCEKKGMKIPTYIPKKAHELPMFFENKHTAQPCGKIVGYISAQAFYGLTAKCKILPIKIKHCPHDKSNCHGNSFAGTNRTVANDTFVVIKARPIPPCHC